MVNYKLLKKDVHVIETFLRYSLLELHSFLEYYLQLLIISLTHFQYVIFLNFLRNIHLFLPMKIKSENVSQSPFFYVFV